MRIIVWGGVHADRCSRQRVAELWASLGQVKVHQRCSPVERFTSTNIRQGRRDGIRQRVDHIQHQSWLLPWRIVPGDALEVGPAELASTGDPALARRKPRLVNRAITAYALDDVPGCAVGRRELAPLGAD